MLKFEFLFEKQYRLPKNVALFVVLMLGIIGTLIVYNFTDETIQRKQSAQFTQDAQEELSAIQNNIENNLQVLYGMEALFNTITDVQRSQFTTLADLFFKRFRATQALMWVPKITQEELSSFITSTQAAFPKFNIYELNSANQIVINSTHPEYFPVFYIAPFLENQSLLGYNLAANALLEPALVKSRDLGMMTISPKVNFLNSTEYSVIVFVPVYKLGVTSDNLEKRRRNLRGYVVGSYKVADLMEKGIDRKYLYPIDFEVFDLTAPAGLKDLYAGQYNPGLFAASAKRLIYDYRVTVAGNVWLFRCIAHEGYYKKDVWVLWLVLIGCIGGFSLLMFVVSKFYEVLEQTTRIAQLDSLTRIPNKLYFEEHLRREISRAQRNNSFLFLMYIDIDKFKSINDKYGHHVGDLFLKAVAKRVKESLRSGDFIARLGGDEFAIILGDIKERDNVVAIARKILQRFSAPFVISGNKLNTSVSIGIAAFPDDAADATGLIQKADTAMYRVKRAGRNNFQSYQE